MYIRWWTTALNSSRNRVHLSLSLSVHLSLTHWFIQLKSVVGYNFAYRVWTVNENRNTPLSTSTIQTIVVNCEFDRHLSQNLHSTALCGHLALKAHSTTNLICSQLKSAQSLNSAAITVWHTLYMCHNRHSSATRHVSTDAGSASPLNSRH